MEHVPLISIILYVLLKEIELLIRLIREQELL